MSPESDLDPLAAEAAYPASTLESLELPLMLATLAEGCATPAGRAAMLALHPGAAATAAAERAERGREGAAALRAEELPGLGGCADVHGLLDAARRRVLEGEEIAGVRATLDRLGELRRWAAARPQYPALAACIDAAPQLTELAEWLRAAVDPRGEVLDDADPALPGVRAEIQKLRKQRGKRLEEIAAGLQQRGVLRQPQPVARGERLLLAVRATHAGRASGAVHDRSQSGDTLFIEPTAVLLLSNRLFEAQARERKLIEQVLRDCTRAVLERAAEVRAGGASLAEVDLACASATWAARHGAAWPDLDGEELRLEDARHPLLLEQLGAAAVVPMSITLGGGHDLLVVTGPNTGGKTMVLRTLGLLAAMARCGLPLSAAEGSAVPQLAGLDADIGDAQSREDSLSTFSGHLVRILRILAAAGPRRLVLIDELGTGTDPEEGAAIGQAVLEELLARGAWVVANTHLGALKLFSLDLPRAENASMEFDPETLAPRFRLLLGVPGASHAVEVAERLGLPEPLLARARKLAARDDRTEKLLADVGRVRREAEVLRERASSQARAAQERSREIEAREATSRMRSQLREKEAESAFLDQARRLAKRLDEDGAALLKRLRGTDRERAEALLQALRAELDGEDLGRRWQDFVKGLKKGDHVWVPRFAREAAGVESGPSPGESEGPPRRHGDGTSAARNQLGPARGRVGMNPVLVVDNDEALVRLLEMAFSRFEVPVCGTGDAAVAAEMLRRGAASALLLDVNLGAGQSGPELLVEWGGPGDLPPSWMVTGTPDDPRLEALEGIPGYRGVIAKPFRLLDLVSDVRTAIAGEEALPAVAADDEAEAELEAEA